MKKYLKVEYNSKSKIIGKVLKNTQNCEYKIIKKDGKNKYYHPTFTIQFLDKYGYVYNNVAYCTVKSGSIINPYYPRNIGNGYIGNYKKIIKYNNIPEKIHKIIQGNWHRILGRCYNKFHKDYRFYGLIGITICERWKCYANFLEDILKLPGYNNYKNYYINKIGNSIELDKDKLIPNNKEYGPKTCLFITGHENKVYKKNVYNFLIKKLNDDKWYGCFKKDNNTQSNVERIINSHHIGCCLLGKRKSTKGYNVRKLKLHENLNDFPSANILFKEMGIIS